MKSKLFKLGIKIWSTNTNLVHETFELVDRGIYQYVELFAVPGSYDISIKQWSSFNVPFVIHAPHYLTGLDLSDPDKKVNNSLLIKETINFANQLKAEYIIVHPGVMGTVKETAKQIKMINDPRILLENVPHYSLDKSYSLLGSTTDEIKEIIEATNIGFCLDLGHVICTNISTGQDILDNFKDFLSIKPRLFHLTDGNITEGIDNHKPLKTGSFPIEAIISMLPSRASITIETSKPTDMFYEYAVNDAKVIRKI